MTNTLTCTEYDIQPAHGGELYITITDQRVQVEVIDSSDDAQVFLTAAEARRAGLRLLAIAESLEDEEA